MREKKNKKVFSFSSKTYKDSYKFPIIRITCVVMSFLSNAFKKKKKKKKRKSNMIPLFRRKFLREFWGKPYGQIPAQSLLQ